MPLTDTALRAIKPADKPQKLFDSNWLFLFVAVSGTKSWRLKYRFQGREKLLTLGQYRSRAGAIPAYNRQQQNRRE